CDALTLPNVVRATPAPAALAAV
ncbi:MAG: hypothetical protein QOF26_1261, partial [Baekduia sp.]|nr:hypothetical protein [Baekduia sp.]